MYRVFAHLVDVRLGSWCGNLNSVLVLVRLKSVLTLPSPFVPQETLGCYFGSIYRNHASAIRSSDWAISGIQTSDVVQYSQLRDFLSINHLPGVVVAAGVGFQVGFGMRGSWKMFSNCGSWGSWSETSSSERRGLARHRDLFLLNSNSVSRAGK
jgi:hypothetical protein